VSTSFLRIGYEPFKNDVWALGIIFYQMVTGGFPWRARNSKDLQDQLIRYVSEEIKINVGRLPLAVKEIVHDCLQVVEVKRDCFIKSLVRPIESALMI
jgi:serine/threonine protein kinase